MNVIWHIKRIYQKYKYSTLKIGKGSNVYPGVYINRPERMCIGDNTYINGGTFTMGEKSNITIGNDCLISYNVHFRTVSHNYEKKDVLIREQGEFEKDIIIGNDVWIGYGAQILPGVSVHDGAVVGAGAVVTHDVAPYTVVGGGACQKNQRSSNIINQSSRSSSGKGVTVLCFGIKNIET